MRYLLTQKGFCRAFYREILRYGYIAFFLLLSPAYAAEGMKSSAPVNITADTLKVDERAFTATFSGNVEALQEKLALHAEKMVVHYLKESQDGKNISRIEVYGNVVLSRPEETAKGDKGEYDVIANTLTLTGNVLLSKDNNMVRGTNLVYNLNTGKSEISGGQATGGRVKGSFVPSKKDK